MKLLKGTIFLREYFEPPRPSKRELCEWIEQGEIPGRILPSGPWVDINRFIGGHTVQKPTTVDLLS